MNVNISEHLDEVEDFELIDELESRDKFKENFAEFSDEHRTVLENLYYALRDGTQEDAIKVINPLLDEKLGRII
ncbi:MAG: hypothetical protein V3R32_05495 [Nitrosomonadaceae bacterium]